MALSVTDPGAARHRSLFLSDLHLGSRRCRARALRAFLARNRCETLVLVGDTFDFWAMRRAAPLPPAHGAVLADLIALTQSGTRLILLPGNHDDSLHALAGFEGAALRLCASFVHEAADGRHYLVTHGDHHDPSLQSLWALARNASFLRERMPHLSHAPQVRRGLAALWRDIKTYQGKAARFQARLLGEARGRGLDGVICGHVHAPACRVTAQGLYLNCGDWVSHCTAIAEGFDGSFRLIAAPGRRLSAPLPALAGAAA